MKKIFNLFSNPISCVMALMMFAAISYGQCVPGEATISVDYTVGGFNAENGWMLWDATNGAQLACFTL